jgi:5-methyltetrahydrofolate--homocysteine methyltransferase
VIESKTKTAVIGFDQPFCVIGERINPTGRKKLAARNWSGRFLAGREGRAGAGACRGARCST